MNRAARVLVGVAALLVGAAAVYTAPQSADVSKPIQYRGAVGDRIVGRAFATTVTGLRFAKTLRLHDGSVVETRGVFLIVDLRVTTRLAIVDLASSTLQVGSVRYGAYADPANADFSAPVSDPGITVEGTLAFEVPSRVRAADAADLVLSRGAQNPDQEDVVSVTPRRIHVDDQAVVVPQTRVEVESPWSD